MRILKWFGPYPYRRGVGRFRRLRVRLHQRTCARTHGDTGG